MTSGQGGFPQGGGPEQGGPPPHGPPPGQPYGQQWPAYAPPPPLPQPTYEGPAPTERPLTVRAALGAFVGSLVLGAIGAVVSFLNWDLLLADTLAQLRVQGSASPEMAQATADYGLQLGVAASVARVAVYGFFVWFAWRGRNWARIVLWVFGGIGLMLGLLSLSGRASPVPFLNGLNLFQVLLLVAGLVGLALPPSNEWFRYQGWLRATGQQR